MSAPTNILVKDITGTYNDLSDIFKIGTRTAPTGTGITLNGADLNQMFAAYDAAGDIGYDTYINGNDGTGNYVDLRTLFSKKFMVSNFTVLNATSTTITIGWTSPRITSGLLSYNLSWGVGGTATVSNIGIPPNIYTITIPTVTANTQYTIGLQALYTNYTSDYSYINVLIKTTSTTVTVNTATSSAASNYTVTNYEIYTYITTNSFNIDICLNLTSATKIGFLLVGGGGSGAVNGYNFGGAGGGGGGGICFLDILNSQINTNVITIRVGSRGGAAQGAASSTDQYNGNGGNYSNIYFSRDTSKYVKCNGGAGGKKYNSIVNKSYSFGGSGGTVDVSGITNVVSYAGGNGGYGIENKLSYNYEVILSKGKPGTTVTMPTVTKSVGGGGGGGSWDYITTLTDITSACAGATSYGGGNGQRQAKNPIAALTIGSGQANTGGGGGGNSGSNNLASGEGGSGYGLFYFFRTSNDFVVTVPDKPNAPTGYIYGYSPTDITIAFTEPTGTVMSYTITVSTSGTITKTFNTLATYYTIRGLDTTLIYNISLTATNLIGTSDASTIVFDKTLLVTNLTVTAQSDAVTIGWTPPTTTGFTGYNISVNGSITNIGIVNSYQIPNLTTNTIYKIGIQAVSTNANYIYIEGSISLDGTAFTYKTPLPPTGLSILGHSSSATSGSIKISFTEPVDTVISYTVTVTSSSGTVTQSFNAPNKYYSINDNLFANLTGTTNITYTISLVSNNYIGQSAALTYSFNPTYFVSNLTISTPTVSWTPPTTTGFTGYYLSVNGIITTIGLVNTYNVTLIYGLNTIGIRPIYSGAVSNGLAVYTIIMGIFVENGVTSVSGIVSTSILNGYRVMTATSNASITLSNYTKIGLILVGGGGSSGSNTGAYGSSGGGGGGATYYMNCANSTINTNTINITVGNRGEAVKNSNTITRVNGNPGSNSIIDFGNSNITCGGGGGGYPDGIYGNNNRKGGSGGTVTINGITGGTSYLGGNGGSGLENGSTNVIDTIGRPLLNANGIPLSGQTTGASITVPELNRTYKYGGGGGGGAWSLSSTVANANTACYGAYGGGNGERDSTHGLPAITAGAGQENTGGGGGGVNGVINKTSFAGGSGFCLVYFPVYSQQFAYTWTPSTPTGLSVISITSTTIKISFTEPADVTSYTVTAVSSTTVTQTFNAPATTYTITGLTNSAYTISLVASNSFGSSSPITIPFTPLLFDSVATVPTLVNGYYSDTNTYRTYSSVTLGATITDGYWGSSLDKASLYTSASVPYASTTKGRGAWKPTDATPWIRIDLTQNFMVTGITVKPRMSGSASIANNEYVQTLRIETSTDNITFISMTTDGTNTTFQTGIQSNTMSPDISDTAYYIPLYAATTARYVKVTLVSWFTAPSFRVGVNYLIS